MTRFSAGFARREITPPLDLAMDGYDAREGRAVGVLHPLFARACYLEDAGGAYFVLALEVLGVSVSLAQQVQMRVHAVTNVPPQSVMVCATHTHSGPHGFSTYPNAGQLEKNFVEWTLECISELALEAQAAAARAQLTYSTSQTAGVAANRVDSGIPVDERLHILSFTHEKSDNLMGMIVNFACHPTVLGADNLYYSGDLFGVAATEIEECLGTVCLLTNGASADISTRFTRADQTHAECARLGLQLSASVMRAIQATGSPQSRLPAECTESNPLLKIAHRTLELPFREIPSKVTAEGLLQGAERAYEAAVARHALASEKRQLWTKVEGARHLLDRAQASSAKGCCIVQLTGLRVGLVVFVGIPGEVFSESFRAPREDSGIQMVPLGLAGGYLGYFPTQLAVERETYEALTSAFDTRVTHRLVEGVSTLIGVLKGFPK